MHKNIVRVGMKSQIEAWVRLGFSVIGHGWDDYGPFSILAELVTA